MIRECFTYYDWSRSYLLPAGVACNIPLRGSVGMLGAHNAARGLLVETCRYTGAAPIALHYTETALRESGELITVTVVARRAGGQLVTVETRTRICRYADPGPGDWAITVNDVPRPGEDRAWPPSPPMQGFPRPRTPVTRPCGPERVPYPLRIRP